MRSVKIVLGYGATRYQPSPHPQAAGEYAWGRVLEIRNVPEDVSPQAVADHWSGLSEWLVRDQFVFDWSHLADKEMGYILQPDTFELRTVPEAADEIGVSARRIRAMAASGVIRGRKLGRDWAFSADEVRRVALLERKPGRPASE